MPQLDPSTNLRKTGFGNQNVSSTKDRIKASSIFSGMFSHSSKNIWVDEYAMLHADCERRTRDAHNHSTLRLNDFIGNDNGYFTTEYGGIAASALSFKIAEDGHTLTAELRYHLDDTYNVRKLDLDTCVADIDGSLTFCPNPNERQ
ncbi:hypothetical protein BJ165DRAFT_112122 [Panaeolus papilionaceus]|nr:hypothetical protein BJ165DRAFT_112122 [Panaeolus papilionaceus]